MRKMTIEQIVDTSIIVSKRFAYFFTAVFRSTLQQKGIMCCQVTSVVHMAGWFGNNTGDCCKYFIVRYIETLCIID